MPFPPRWHGHLPALREAVAALETPALDRGMIEQLFGISRSGAIRLMARVERPRAGAPNVLDREKLLAWLDQLAATRPVVGSVERERRLRAELARAAQEAGTRATAVVSVPMSGPDSSESNEAAGWPAGVTLPEPGLLAIRFSSAEQLLGCVLALAEAAAGDYGAFRARLEGAVAEGAAAPPELLSETAL